MILDVNNPEFTRNPYPYYAEIRKSGRPIWAPLSQDYDSSGIWLFGSYADALTIFKKSTVIRKYAPSQNTQECTSQFYLNPLNRDGPDHVRLRRLVTAFFSMPAVQALEPVIEVIATELVGGLQRRQFADLINDYAMQLPLQVIAHIIEIPPGDLGQIRKWSKAIMIDSLQVTDEIRNNRIASLAELSGYLSAKIDAHSANTKNGLITHLLVQERDGQTSRDELIGTLILLLLAGHETTIDLIGNGLWLLLSHPSQLKLLLQRPELISGAVEEILRYESPAQRSTFRVATTRIQVGACIVDPGQPLAAIIGSANRDEKIFQNPDGFDIQRSPNPHLAFGVGAHNCIGKNLARMEAEIAIKCIIECLSRSRLTQTGPAWKNNSFFRGLESLTIELMSPLATSREANT
ncbi:MAG: cytochrome P450 [Hydrogenophilales bacterium]|nr:cytochrome P450 [Hydrogenophilales bacterium]